MMDGGLMTATDSTLRQATWFVAVTAPRAERIAKEQYSRLGIATFLPLRERPPTPEKPLIVEPVWPGYLFVGSPFNVVTNEHGIPEQCFAVRRLIRDRSGNILLVPSGFVEQIKERADQDGLIEKYQAPIRWSPHVGETVRIKYGALAGHFGVVDKIKGLWVKVAFSCFGGQSMLDTTLEQIEAAL